ncbi:glucans biosynthesis glucosyltransferase MdoH [Bradyrhizobium erythrophlei]|jgi:membrane glycosyltransferase|uniref:Glucans biosynthesis glucosyltransferase H n=1 Tax=Bradyrhizobium erythrophlei TaxID=1437360 RepID=A0A1M7UCI3_9BRAD|nr:glucans biosynthesis glucosyltransferase MdoH [Bradyrhizobium erythrophlei]SHN80665.1 membrane glycosyltransferase [Bradyrhizobium erythrophlei]
MDTLEKSPEPAWSAIADHFLPPESTLSMEPCRLDQITERKRASSPFQTVLLFRRAFIFSGATLLTIAGGYEMYRVVKVGGVTVLEVMLLAFFLILLAWVAFSFMSALAGFFVLLTRHQGGLKIDRDGPLPQLSSRTAMLLPTYNEDPHDLMARLRAMYESVAATGNDAQFDWFLLSDTTDPDTWVREEVAFIALRRACGADRLYYRHRSDNTARKSGNIAEWVRRFGAAYDHMIVLDADSLMAGDTIVRLARTMENYPDVALIQTQPVIVNARSLFSRLQQFAGRVYGPIVAAGNAWWHGPESNYWGHNAIIRVRAFAEEAGLPELRGRQPFGGHILSHDFVEAALMRRAGWAVYMAPELGGSFEEVPPSILDFAARDRRWCQGNLQHIAVLRARGLHWVSRIHLLTGIGSYVTAPMWLIFLILGLLISLQANFIRPEYFPKGFSLFPTWPQQDPVLAAWVFAATMGLLVLPKLLAYLALISHREDRTSFSGSIRVFGGILSETLLSALIAPSMMIFQSKAVAEILLGRDAGWQVQHRSGGEVARHEIYRKLAVPTLCGVLMGLSAFAVSIPLLLWMSPVIVGLVLAIPLGLLISRQSRAAGLFATPEDNRPPPVVLRANELTASARIQVTGALQQLRQDAEMLKYHLNLLPRISHLKLRQIDVPLATARAKIDQCETFEEAVDWLDKTEIRAVLNNAVALQCVLELRSTGDGG